MSLIIYNFIFFLLSINAYDKEALARWSMGLDKDKIAIAINCGSNEDITDILGIEYSADKGYIGGVASDEG